MPFPYDKYPWLNFQGLNLAYFIRHFQVIFQQWDQLYHDLLDWQDATDADLAEWKTAVESGISSWETGLMSALEVWKSDTESGLATWKTQTESDIGTWEAATLAALEAWKTATTAVFEQIRTEAAASATAAERSASAAETAKTAAQTAQAAAEAAAAGIASELAQIQTNTAEISELKPELKLIQDFDWNAGFVSLSGVISHETSIRRYSGLIVCPANTSITYRAELHPTVSGISFYDNTGAFIIGYAHTDTTHPENTVTSPINAAFLRLSTTTAVMEDTFVSFSSNGMTVLNDRIAKYEYRANRYIPFVTSGSNRSALYTDISDVMVAEIVDDSYEMFLYYESGNTPWLKKIVLADYPNPISLQLRKADNSAMPPLSAETVAVAIRKTSFVTFNDLDTVNTLYVDPNGSDTNSGTNRAEALATIQKAIDLGAKTILVKEGTYSQGFTLSNADGISVVIDHYYDSFTAGTDEDNPKIIIDGNSSGQDGITVIGCTNCNFGNIEVKNTTKTGFKIQQSDSLRFDDCIAHDIGIGQSGSICGFMITYTNADFYNCVCYNIGTTSAGTGAYHYDGFNIHGTGTTNFINCKAWNCEDDGISHHDACCGLVDGGEWYNCGKGGIASPTYGAKVNISNVYCHHNKVGIYADNNEAVTDRGNLIFSNCVCKDNTMNDIIVGNYYKVIAINCVYDTVSGSANITRFGITS